MLKFVLRRLMASVLVLFAATYVMYLLTAYSGDPLEDLRTSTARNKDELIQRRIDVLQLNVPPYLRYFLWLGGVLGGLVGKLDLGKNISGQDVASELGSAVLVTLQLVMVATITAILLGVIVGIATALRQYSAFDYSITFMSFLFFSLPVFWVAVLLKQYLAIGFNDFLENPQIPFFVILGLSIAAAVVWPGIIGGTRRLKWRVATIAFVINAVLLAVLNLTGWFSRPGIGPITGLILGISIAVIVTSLSVGLENRRALKASLLVIAFGMVAWLPFNLASPYVGLLAFLGLAVATVFVGYITGYLMGGEDKRPVARTSAITALLMGAIIAVDRFMQAWQPYFESSYISGRPFATVGAQTPNLQGSFWVMGVDKFTHILLPTIALVLIGFAGYTRYSRASMLETMNQDFIRTARAKGLSERTVVVRHAFRNSMVPLTTLVAFDFAGVIGGAVITERVFSWSGMGSLFIEGLHRVDVNTVMGFFLITGSVAIIFNMLADIVYTLLDPRIRVSS